jgi:3-methyladenine DNA glycosylase AlkD
MLETLHADVLALVDPERAKTNAWFLQMGPGGYGEGDQAIGLTVPQIRALARKYRELSIEDAETLLHSPLHEERALALVILVQRFRKGDAVTRERIYDLYLANTAYVNNWDLVDGSADAIVGPYLADMPKDELFRLAASEVVWERRIAMIATYAYIKAGDCTVAQQIAETLLNDKHDLIHKAVGWMLRETGKKCGREHLIAFLDQHAATMPRTTLRYALEHFNPEERLHYMSLRQKSRPASA